VILLSRIFSFQFSISNLNLKRKCTTGDDKVTSFLAVQTSFAFPSSVRLASVVVMAGSEQQNLMDYLYDDLISGQEGKAAQEQTALEEATATLDERIVRLEEEIERLQKKLAAAKSNLVSLLKTARTEIRRKDDRITELKRQLDDITFRRALKTGTRKEYEAVFGVARPHRDESELYAKVAEEFCKGKKGQKGKEIQRPFNQAKKPSGDDLKEVKEDSKEKLTQTQSPSGRGLAEKTEKTTRNQRHSTHSQTEKPASQSEPTEKLLGSLQPSVRGEADTGETAAADTPKASRKSEETPEKSSRCPSGHGQTDTGASILKTPRQEQNENPGQAELPCTNSRAERPASGKPLIKETKKDHSEKLQRHQTEKPTTSSTDKSKVGKKVQPVDESRSSSVHGQVEKLLGKVPGSETAKEESNVQERLHKLAGYKVTSTKGPFEEALSSANYVRNRRPSGQREKRALSLKLASCGEVKSERSTSDRGQTLSSSSQPVANSGRGQEIRGNHLTSSQLEEPVLTRRSSARHEGKSSRPRPERRSERTAVRERDHRSDSGSSQGSTTTLTRALAFCEKKRTSKKLIDLFGESPVKEGGSKCHKRKGDEMEEKAEKVKKSKKDKTDVEEGEILDSEDETDEKKKLEVKPKCEKSSKKELKEKERKKIRREAREKASHNHKEKVLPKRSSKDLAKEMAKDLSQDFSEHLPKESTKGCSMEATKSLMKNLNRSPKGSPKGLSKDVPKESKDSTPTQDCGLKTDLCRNEGSEQVGEKRKADNQKTSKGDSLGEAIKSKENELVSPEPPAKQASDTPKPDEDGTSEKPPAFNRRKSATEEPPSDPRNAPASADWTPLPTEWTAEAKKKWKEEDEAKKKAEKVAKQRKESKRNAGEDGKRKTSILRQDSFSLPSSLGEPVPAEADLDDMDTADLETLLEAKQRKMATLQKKEEECLKRVKQEEKEKPEKRVSPRKNKGNKMQGQIRGEKSKLTMTVKLGVSGGLDAYVDQHQVAKEPATPTKGDFFGTAPLPPPPPAAHYGATAAAPSSLANPANPLDFTSPQGIANLLKGQLATRCTVSPVSGIIRTPSSVGSRMASPVSVSTAKKVLKKNNTYLPVVASFISFLSNLFHVQLMSGKKEAPPQPVYKPKSCKKAGAAATAGVTEGEVNVSSGGSASPSPRKGPNKGPSRGKGGEGTRLTRKQSREWMTEQSRLQARSQRLFEELDESANMAEPTSPRTTAENAKTTSSISAANLLTEDLQMSDSSQATTSPEVVCKGKEPPAASSPARSAAESVAADLAMSDTNMSTPTAGPVPNSSKENTPYSDPKKAKKKKKKKKEKKAKREKKEKKKRSSHGRHRYSQPSVMCDESNTFHFVWEGPEEDA